MLKCAFYSLGCKVNHSENLNYLQQFKELDFKIVDFKDKADIYLINTCAVTKEAERESWQYIRRALRKNPNAYIIVTGCIVKENFFDIDKISENNNILVIPNSEKDKIIYKVYNFLYQKELTKKFDTLIPDINSTTNIRLNLKITDGCQNYCSYCIIPYRRGKVKSLDIESVINLVNKAYDLGYKEIVLTGINLGNYGKDFIPSNSKLAPLEELLIKLNKETNINRIRLSSLNINSITDNLIDILKESNKICNHLHIPLQSGSDKILRLMKRNYNTSLFIDTINKLRKNLPELTITTDVIVGFPEETESDFLDTYNLIKSINFNKLHVFPFSPRPETEAFYMKDRVPKEIIKTRTKILFELGETLYKNWLKSNLDKIVEVLIETVEPEYAKGHTANYLPVELRAYNRVKKNDLVNVRLIKINKDKLYGECS